MSPSEVRFSENESRNAARENLKTAFAYLARAFNHCDNGELPYRYADDVQAQVIELGVQISVLIERGAIEPNPGHARHLVGEAARKNEPLQALIRKAERAARGRTKRRPDQ